MDLSKTFTISMNSFWLVHPFGMRLSGGRAVSGLAIFANAHRHCLAIEVYPSHLRIPYIEFLTKNVARYGAPANLVVDRDSLTTGIDLRYWAATNRICICFKSPSRSQDDLLIRHALRTYAKHLSDRPSALDLRSLTRTVES